MTIVIAALSDWLRSGGAEEVPEEARILRDQLTFRLGERIMGGAAYRTRTCDPRITNAMLYQLS